mgnify:CR=1 FL=1
MMTIEQHSTETITKINFRVPSEIKEVVERAALVSGLTMTDFAIQTLLERANEVLEHYEMRKLSDRDRDIFLALLDEEPQPNEALRGAFAAHDRLIAK